MGGHFCHLCSISSIPGRTLSVSRHRTYAFTASSIDRLRVHVSESLAAVCSAAIFVFYSFLKRSHNMEADVCLKTLKNRKEFIETLLFLSLCFAAAEWCYSATPLRICFNRLINYSVRISLYSAVYHVRHCLRL